MGLGTVLGGFTRTITLRHEPSSFSLDGRYPMVYWFRKSRAIRLQTSPTSLTLLGKNEAPPPASASCFQSPFAFVSEDGVPNPGSTDRLYTMILDSCRAVRTCFNLYFYGCPHRR